MSDQAEASEPSGKEPHGMREPPEERRCTAKSKQRGERCCAYTVEGKRVCWFHGGASTGPREPSKLLGNSNAVKHGVWRAHLSEKLLATADEIADDDAETSRHRMATVLQAKLLGALEYADVKPEGLAALARAVDKLLPKPPPPDPPPVLPGQPLEQPGPAPTPSQPARTPRESRQAYRDLLG